MVRREWRIWKRDAVTKAYEELKNCVGGEFRPGYFNSAEVLAAECEGLSVCDGVLGHVLSTPLDTEKNPELLNC